MLDTITTIQCFVRVRCLVRHCTGCEVNCNGLQILNIKFTFHIVTSYYDRCLERKNWHLVIPDAYTLYGFLPF